MITNQNQYRITKAQRAKFQSALESFDADEVAARIGSALLARAEREAIESEIEVLGRQLAEYEQLQSGNVHVLTATGLLELPELFVRARIARGYSQRELAEKLGLAEQQIQRYESEQYAGASLARLSKVADALGLEITETAALR